MTSEREILNLLYEYCWLVDQGRYEEIGELFAEADIYFGDTLAYSRDKAAFAGMFKGANISYAPDNTPRTIHMCIDPVIVVDEAAGTARAKHYTVVVQGIPGACAQYFKFTDPESEYAFAPYMNSLMPIPDEMTDVQCAMMEPFGVGLGAVNKAGVKEGDTVVVLGTGNIGISSLQWCKARGARAIVVGRGRHRLEIAKKCGADHVVSTLDGDCYGQVAALTEETGWYWGKETTTVDAVIDCAGYPGSFNDALKIVKPGGAVCLAALYEDTSQVNPQYIVNKEPKILGTCDNDLLGAMKGILAGTASVEPLLDDIVGIEDFQEAFDRQMDGTAEKILIDMTK